MSNSTDYSKRDLIHVALWVAQAILAAAFGMAGVLKLFTPIAELATMMNWVSSTPEMLVRFIGAAELAGAIGIIVPALTRIAPMLTPLAAAGFAVIQILAIGTHISLGEVNVLPINIALLAMALFVVWGRWKKRIIQPRMMS